MKVRTVALLCPTGLGHPLDETSRTLWRSDEEIDLRLTHPLDSPQPFTFTADGQQDAERRRGLQIVDASSAL
jgi:hypothetical protein